MDVVVEKVKQRDLTSIRRSLLWWCYQANLPYHGKGWIIGTSGSVYVSRQHGDNRRKIRPGNKKTNLVLPKQHTRRWRVSCNQTAWQCQHGYDCWNVMFGPRCYTAVKSGLSARLWRPAYRRRKCGFYAVCCRYLGKTRYQTKKC